MDLRQHAQAMRANATPAERMMWLILRSSPLDVWHFRRQVAFAPLYIADFASHSARLVVEVDGQSHDLTGFEDARRTAWFAAKEFRVVRFSNAAVLGDRDSVWREVCGLVPAGGPPPRSRKGASRPPRRGEGD